MLMNFTICNFDTSSIKDGAKDVLTGGQLLIKVPGGAEAMT
jgi:hypothetical protein